MKFTLGNVELSGDAREEVSNLQGTYERLVQVSQYVRGNSAVPRNRNNDIWTVAFTVTRKHDSIAASCKYFWEHPLALPRTGTLKIRNYSPEGGEEAIFTADNVAVKTVVCAPIIGLTTVFTYTLILGEVTT